MVGGTAALSPLSVDTAEEKTVQLTRLLIDRYRFSAPAAAEWVGAARGNVDLWLTAAADPDTLIDGPRHIG